jgi:aminopeptidase N
VNSYYLAEHKEWGEGVLNYARDSLRAYQQSFAPYPFAEFDVVEAPIFGGGMEYPGLIMLDQLHYEHGGEYLEFLTAHEVAHQWWYSVVGNDQVNLPWLDESLSNFSIVYYYEHTYDRGRADLAFDSFVARRYENLTPEGQNVAVQQPVDAFDPDEYGAIVYGKGAVFFYQLRQALGDDVFLAVLRQYYQDRQYKLATGDDLLRVAEQISGQELDDMYEQWILGAE